TPGRAGDGGRLPPGAGDRGRAGRIVRRPGPPGDTARGVLDDGAGAETQGGVSAQALATLRRSVQGTLLRSVAKAGFGARMNLALFLPNWVGDAVVATPAVRALRRAYPAARVTGVLRRNVADVLAGTGWLDDTLFLDSKGPWARRWWAVAAALRRRRIDLAVLFPNSFRAALVAWLGRC